MTFLQLHVATRQLHVLPDLQNRALLSIGQFCDHRFQVHYNKTATHLTNSDTTIHGSIHPSNRLCYIELNPQYSSPASGTGPVTHAANNAYSMTAKRNIVQYLQYEAFIPTFSTWTKAIDAGYIATWTGLTSKLVCKHLPLSLSTTKGYLRQNFQNMRSTKPVLPKFIPETADIFEHDLTIEPKVCSNPILIKAITVTGKISTNQTGRFPFT